MRESQPLGSELDDGDDEPGNVHQQADDIDVYVSAKKTKTTSHADTPLGSVDVAALCG